MFLKHRDSITKYNTLYAAYEDSLRQLYQHSQENPDGIPYNGEVLDEPEKPALLKPVLMVMLTDLIDQWVGEVKGFSDVFDPIIYYGDDRECKSGGTVKVKGHLEKNHDIFKPHPKDKQFLVFTSLSTFMKRHGPSEVQKYRLSEKGFTKKQSETTYFINEPEFPGNLDGCFDVIVIDEAHSIKNDETSGHATIRWLNAQFLILATASVAPNRVNDFQGYMEFVDTGIDLWTDENLRKWEVTDKINPYELADNHPAACLRYTTKAVKKFITNVDKAKKPSPAPPDKSGFYMSMVWQRCMIRRTYASKNPAKPNHLIGEDICRFFTRRIVCRFTNAEFQKYEAISMEAEMKLIKFIDDKVVWNRKWSRKLLLNSTWLGFHYISDLLHANSVQYWKQEPRKMLHQWLRLLIDAMKTSDEQNIPILPDEDDVFGILALFCRGSPKLRATLRIIADLIVLQGRKLVIWCAVPANQLLLQGCLSLLGIGNVCYSSELDRKARTSSVKAFTEDIKCKVFLGSWYVGSTGLNLQAQANHALEFDHPWSMGVQVQGRGRLRRMAQLYDVENFELYCANSFQSRVIANAISKYIPNAMAELSLKLNQDDGMIDQVTEEKELVVAGDKWYLHGDELFQGPDHRIAIHKLQPLSPTELCFAILDTARGSRIEAEEDKSDWEEAEAEFEPPIHLPIREFNTAI